MNVIYAKKTCLDPRRAFDEVLRPFRADDHQNQYTQGFTFECSKHVFIIYWDKKLALKYLQNPKICIFINIC